MRRRSVRTLKGIVLLTADGDGRLAVWTGSAERLFGHPAHAVVGRPFRFLFPDLPGPDDAGGDRTVLSLLADAGEPVNTRARGRDGAGIPVELIVRRLEGDGDPVFGIVVVDRSADERAARARVSMLESEKWARARAERERDRAFLLGSASRALEISLDMDDRLRHFARSTVPAFADICVVDLTAGEDSFRRVASVRSDRAPAALAEELEDLLLPDGSGNVIDVALRTGTEELIPRVEDLEPERLASSPENRRLFETHQIGSLLSVPVTADDAVIGGLTFLTMADQPPLDEEDLRTARELGGRMSAAVLHAREYGRAVDTSRAREEVLRIVSHDLRQPVNAILLGTNILRGKLPPDSSSEREVLHQIESAANRLNRMSRDLLAAGSIEAGVLSVVLARQRPHHLVEEAVHAHEKAAEEKSVRLRADLPDDLPVVAVDQDRIFQVLSNLLSNAIGLSPPDGEVKIRAEAREDDVRFSVSDSGPGIPVDEQAHVFDAFWRGEDNPGPGSGLGLTIAKGIVEGHMGKLWVESEEGEGATFHFTVPQAKTRDSDLGEGVES